MTSYETLKVFSTMPEEVTQAFFKQMRGYGNGVANDCYVGWYVQPATFSTDGFIRVNLGYNPIVDTWLLEQGCVEDELVIIEHCW